MPKQIKASICFIISNVMVKGISFITLPIFSRMLSIEEYGVVSVYQSWVSVISILTTLTIWGGVFNVGMVKYSDKKDEMISSFQGMAVTITWLAALISFAVLPMIEPLFGMSGFLIICMYLEILAQIPFYLWSTKQRYEYEYKMLTKVTIALSILNPVLGIIAVNNATQHKAEARIVCGMLTQLVVGIIFFSYNQKRGKSYFNKELWKFGFLFNIVLIPHYLSMQILNQSDRIMINNICGSGDAGIYSVANNFAMLLSLITNGINSSLTPHIYECMKGGNVAKLKNQTTTVILIVAALTVGLMAIVPDIFFLLLPESYYDALKAIPPVAAGAFFLFLYPLFGSVEFYFEENKFITVASFSGAILNIILNYIFIHRFGFIAAAYTTLFCYICFSLCHYSFMKKAMKKRSINIEIYDLKAIMTISMAVILGTALMVYVYDTMLIRWMIIGLFLAIAIWKRKYLVFLLDSIKGNS